MEDKTAAWMSVIIAAMLLLIVAQHIRIEDMVLDVNRLTLKVGHIEGRFCIETDEKDLPKAWRIK